MRFSRSLHGLRGLASLMVFYAHVTYGFWDHFYHGDPLLARIMPYWANFGTFGVELFFVISGFVITQSCLNYGPAEFAGRRFMRLYPLFALFTLLYFCANSVLHIAPGRGSATDLAFNLLFLDVFVGSQSLTPNAWSITFEVWYYVCTYLLVYAFIHRRERFNPLLALAAVALSAFMVAAFDITAYFVGGVGLYAIKARYDVDESRFHSVPLFAAATAVIVGIAAAFDFDPVSYFSHPGMQFVALALLLATLCAVYQVLDERNPLARVLVRRPFAFAGTISYTVYLVHPYVYMVMRMIGQKTGIGRYPWEWTLPPYLIIVTALTLALSWVIHRLVEVGPYRLVFHSKVFHERGRTA